MTEDEFHEYISKLWAMIIWGNKEYIINKYVEDNGFDNLKKGRCSARGSALFAVRPGLTKKAKRPIMLYVKRIDGESMPANLAQRGRPSAVSRPESLLAEVRS